MTRRHTLMASAACKDKATALVQIPASMRPLTPAETRQVSGGNALDTVTGSFVGGGGGCTSRNARMFTCFI